MPLASWGDKAKLPVVCLTWPAALLFLNFGSLCWPSLRKKSICSWMYVRLTPQGQRRPNAG